MDVHAAQLTNLSALLYEMHIILERTKRDLTDFSSKKDKAVALIENEELPGMDVAAVLHATAPIIRDAIETNASAIDEFRQRVSEMKLARENERSSGPTDELTYWTPSSDNQAWNIALPGDEDVVVVVPTDSSREQGAGKMFSSVLQYHQDVADSGEHPKLFIPWQDLGSLHNELHSRRVVLRSLPRGTNAMQVLSAIRCYGGVLSVVVADDVLASGSSCKKTKTALVEFVYAKAAADFASHVDEHRLRLRFQDSDGAAHEVQLYHVPTPSWHQNELNYELLSAGATRALCMPGFPVEAIWHLMTKLGTKVISKVDLQGGDTGENKLTIEFVSLFEADRAAHFVKRGRVDVDYDATGNKMRYVADSSQRGDMQGVYAETGGLIERVEPDILQKTWDQEPFNTFKPAKQPRFNPGAPSPAPAAVARVPAKSCPKRTNQDILAEYFDMEPTELRDFLQDREHFQDTRYKIVGSNITLTRHRYSWSISKEDDVKLLMANTLHSPEWADEWDAHFEVQGTINLGRWERYGMLAEHRRQLAAEQHVDTWAVPRCEGSQGCDWACRALKDTPAASMIKEWRRKRREDA
ncbi:hypothetical protein C2857_003210 [Epichloe festucae Fl1]|uniref:Uncharacterized protein n=1 Tax=Epichloe festucae (strain Fl1) TaxID=877507 RepID=A0A7U3Q1W6_EPIFF|nr:hypothetical protein C2857_003210 [Epichloe festucae Fl1]